MEQLKLYFLTVTKYARTSDSIHKSCIRDFAWRTCHDKLPKDRVIKDLNI